MSQNFLKKIPPHANTKAVFQYSFEEMEFMMDFNPGTQRARHGTGKNHIGKIVYISGQIVELKSSERKIFTSCVNKI